MRYWHRKMNCPICRSEQIHVFLRAYDDRYGYPGKFDLIRCSDCGHAFLRADFSPQQLMELYTDYYPRKSFDIEQFRPCVERAGFFAWLNGLRSSAFRWVPHNVRVLDVGCGFGETLAYHTARGCEVYGVEADENIRRVAERFGFKVHIGLFDDSEYESDYFDYVTMDQVIEHVTDPVATLRGVARILKPDGRVILSCPNANGWVARMFGRLWINWHTPYHLQFFSRASIQLAAKQSGLAVSEIRTITSSEWLLYQWIHIMTCPKAGETSCFWSPDKKAVTFRQRLAIKLLVILHKARINHLLTRLFDALGMGDNYVCVLRRK